jgi:3-hydroxybutyryl-CoA dehydrogenase
VRIARRATRHSIKSGSLNLKGSREVCCSKEGNLAEIKTLGIIGSGTMGGGLAQIASQVGKYDVIMIDISDGILEQSMKRIRKSLEDFWVSKGKMTAAELEEVLARIKPKDKLEDLINVDYVIESAPEKLEIKLDIFEKLDNICRPDVILSTNTSGLSVTKIASVTKRPRSVVGMHFSNPVAVMKRLEIVRGLQTSDATVEKAKEVGVRLGKETPQIVKKDYPGFTGNRLLNLLINEAFNMVDQGVATADDIDTGVKLGLGHRMGPLETADLIGLDVVLDVAENLCREYGPRFMPSLLLKKLVEAGYLGKKTGTGVYDYSTGEKRPFMF